MFFRPATTEMRGALLCTSIQPHCSSLRPYLRSSKLRVLLHLLAVDTAIQYTSNSKKERSQTWPFPTNIQLQIPQNMEEVNNATQKII